MHSIHLLSAFLSAFGSKHLYRRKFLQRIIGALDNRATPGQQFYQLQKLSKQWKNVAVQPTPQNDGKHYLLRISLVSISYQSRIVLVSFSYHPRIVLVSSSYHSRFRKRKQYGNDTETIREAREEQGRKLPSQNIFKFLKLYNYGKTQWYLNQTPGISR